MNGCRSPWQGFFALAVAVGLAWPMAGEATVPPDEAETLQARVALTSRPLAGVREIRDLLADPEEFTTATLPPDWQRQESALEWQPSSSSAPPSPLTWRLSRPVIVGGIHGSQELLLEFREADLNMGGHLEVDLGLTSHGLVARGERRIRFFVGGNRAQEQMQEKLVPGAAWAFAANNWLPKDNNYLIARELGLPWDDDWRTSPDKESIVLQRRFHAEISGIKAMDFTFPEGADEVQINLRLGFGGLPRPTETLTWITLAKRTVQTELGSAVRIEVQDLLKSRFPDEKRVFLEEVLIFVPGSIHAIPEPSKPTHLRFWSLDPAVERAVQEEENATLEWNKRGVLPARSLANVHLTEMDGRGGTRLVMDLSSLPDLTEGGMRLNEVIVRLHPPRGRSAYAFRLEKIGFRVPAKGERPLFLDAGQRVLEGWGMAEQSLREDRVFWPEMVGYAVFPPRTALAERVARESGPSPSPSPPRGGREGKNPKDIKSSPPKARLEKWTGSLELPMAGTLKKGGYFFLKLDGTWETIQRLTLQFPQPGDPVGVSGEILPNQPWQWEGEDFAFTKVRLLFQLETPAEAETIFLREAALFHRAEVGWAEAFVMPLPLRGREALLPESDASFPGGGGVRVRANLLELQTAPGGSGARVSWRTPLPDGMMDVEGVTLFYRFPNRHWLAPCTLRMAQEVDGTWVERKLCPDTLTGRLLLEPGAGAWSRGRFPDKGLRWSAVLPDGVMRGAGYVQILAEGVVLRSVQAQLLHWPLVDGQGNMLIPLASQSPPTWEQLQRGEARIRLKPESSQPVFDRAGSAPVNSPYLALLGTVSERELPPGKHPFVDFPTAEPRSAPAFQPRPSGVGLRLVTGVVAVALAVALLWRVGPGRLLSVGGALLGGGWVVAEILLFLGGRLLTRGLHSASSSSLRLGLRLANRGVLLLLVLMTFLGLGEWAGGKGQGAALLACGALFLEARWSGWSPPGGPWGKRLLWGLGAGWLALSFVPPLFSGQFFSFDLRLLGGALGYPVAVLLLERYAPATPLLVILNRLVGVAALVLLPLLLASRDFHPSWGYGTGFLLGAALLYEGRARLGTVAWSARGRGLWQGVVGVMIVWGGWHLLWGDSRNLSALVGWGFYPLLLLLARFNEAAFLRKHAWGLAALAGYVLGALFFQVSGENYFFTGASLLMVMYVHTLAEHHRACLMEGNGPWARFVGGEHASVFMLGFLGLLGGMAVLILLNLKLLANPLSTASYFLMLTTLLLRGRELVRMLDPHGQGSGHA